MVFPNKYSSWCSLIFIILSSRWLMVSWKASFLASPSCLTVALLLLPVLTSGSNFNITPARFWTIFSWLDAMVFAVLYYGYLPPEPLFSINLFYWICKHDTPSATTTLSMTQAGHLQLRVMMFKRLTYHYSVCVVFRVALPPRTDSRYHLFLSFCRAVSCRILFQTPT